MPNQKKWLSVRSITALFATLWLICISVLNYYTSPESSDEWIYTIEWFNFISIPLIAGCLLIIFVPILRKTIIHKWGIALVFFICCAIFAIPLLSPYYFRTDWRFQYFLSTCWACGLFLTGMFLFVVASRARAFMASLWCLLGSIALGLASLEIVLLTTSQSADAIANLSETSRYSFIKEAVTEYQNWVPYECGLAPAPKDRETKAYHKELKFDDPLYDVLYSFDKHGRRAMPAANPDAPNDLILLGCSFTFGHGLENEQTWAWQLAKNLGPDWKLENYGANAYSASHALCLLEHHLIAPQTGKRRYALFLGIDDHLRRNDFFPNTPHYELNEAKEAVAGGKPKFNWAYLLPATFNGSQLARETGRFIHQTVMKYPDKMTETYLAILKKISRLLLEDYETKLIVLLWPDFEYIQPKIEALGIPVILARPMLPDWNKMDDPGRLYRINALYEGHPNPKATKELAEGLAKYFEKLAE